MRDLSPRHAEQGGTPVRKLLVVRLSAMGDIVHTLPAAWALRHAFPAALIGWVVEERWAELLCTPPTPRSGPRSPQRPLADRIHVANLATWRSSLISNRSLHQIASGLSELRGIGYEVAVDFQGAVRSAVLARWSGAPTVYGACQPRENAASMLYTRQVLGQGTHVVEQNLSLAEAVAGRALQVPPIELPYDEVAEAFCDRLLQSHGGGRYAVLNPGAGWGAKQWPAERYGQVALRLRSEGLVSLVNFGPGEEALARTVEQASEGAATGVHCSVTQLIALVRRASVFIGGDTGPTHLAALMGVPVVGLFGPTNPARNGPWGGASIVLRSAASRTSHARASEPDRGLLEITVEQAVAAAQSLLGGARG